MSERGPKQHDPRWVSQVTDELTDTIKQRATEGRITCPVLRKIAEEQGVPYKVAGTAADLAGVRVKNCELDCF